MEGTLQEILHMAKVLAPCGWTTLDAMKITNPFGSAHQNRGILSHVITEQKRLIFLVLVSLNLNIWIAKTYKCMLKYTCTL